MHVDINRLKGSIVSSGMTQEAVARAIGVDNSTFIRKMKGEGVSFSVGQMHKLVDVLALTPEETALIFLCRNSH